MRVSRCRAFIGKNELHDFKNYKAKSQASAVVVKLMNSHDTADVTAELGFTIDYVPKAGVSEIDFRKEFDGNGTFRVAKKGGGQTLYTECKLLSIGEETIDGEKEVVKTIDVFAGGRSDEE